MASTAETLIDLLDGDLVRLATPEVDVEAEVVDHDRTHRGEGWRYTVRFMPVGDAATAVSADRFVVTVETDGQGGWEVGPLVAEVYVEEDLTYDHETRGDLRNVEVFDGP